MLRYIENLQRKPVGVRKRAAFFIAAFITGAFFLVWLLFLEQGLY